MCNSIFWFFFISYVLGCLIYNKQSKNFVRLNVTAITNSAACDEGCKSEGVKWQWSSYTKDPNECLCFENVNEGTFDNI